jgi:asparagine synthase (glutamine-hydrolysing)
MCGIVGTFSFKGGAFRMTDRLLTRMRDTMVHRGPDGGGNWISEDGEVGLGHRRLSIIDLSTAANQPMSNEDDSLWIVFNGEIYNHQELRRELTATGRHRWKTDHSDTECILHAFEEWGIAAIDRLRGMFAFALWDARNRQMWLVRDRIGVKPLYYSVHHGRITFASEIKALLEDPDQKREVNEIALRDYLSFLTCPAPDTLFAGIHKLPSGTWLRISADGTIQERRYWDVWDHTSPLISNSDEEIAERVLHSLREAVHLRQVSDVPVGVFLSGGIDSSTNAALFSRGDGGPVKTFTIGYRGEYASYSNELEYARMMAKSIGAEHHERLLDVDDLIRFLPRMVHLQDEPIGDPVCVPVYYVSELARQNGVVVCQVGEGADELFWGYPSWKVKLRLQQLADVTPRPLLVAGQKLFGTAAPSQMSGREYEALARAAHGSPVFWGGADAFTHEGKRRLFSAPFRRRIGTVSSWESIEPIRRRFLDGAWEKSHLHWMSYLDLNMRLPELLLMRVDKMSMGVSVEGRVPFLDHKFVELAMSIPQSVKTRGGVLKYILKKAVRGTIPDALIDRKKQGFAVPIYEWLWGRFGAQATAELERFSRETDYFDRREVERLTTKERGARLWYVLNFVLWWKHYIAQEPSSLMPEINRAARQTS